MYKTYDFIGTSIFGVNSQDSIHNYASGEGTRRSWYCCCSAAQLHLTICDPMDCSTPGFPILHYLPEFAHTDVHWVKDAIQPSHPLLPPSPPALNLSHHQSFQMSQLFASGGQSIGVSASTSVCPMNIQDWSLGWTDWISLKFKGLSRLFSNTITGCLNFLFYFLNFIFEIKIRRLYDLYMASIITMVWSLT